ncbi:MAG TPA: CPBP family intramembrane glutamic endopeptidase [Bryobacteraceae bacterium]|nr:CPBP family intramembrane glutamic endopeptidase [Bryobacteraceae bacterium]
MDRLAFTLHGVFFSSRGLRAGWRALLYLLLLIAFSIVPGAPVDAAIEQHRGNVLWSLAGRLVAVVIVFAAARIMARFVDGRPVTDFGLARQGLGPRLAAGLLSGFLSLSLLLLLIRAAGCFSIHGFDLHGAPAIARYTLQYTIMFILVALFEELLTRGYLLFVLSEGMGFWGAAVLLAALFAAGHLRNAGENKFGIANAMAIAVFLAWTVRRTGSLWWAIGYHMTWDWAESFFYGVPDSGIVSRGHLLGTSLTGPSWLSGGSAGPEGSVFVLLVIAVLAVSVLMIFPATPPREMQRSAPAWNPR